VAVFDMQLRRISVYDAAGKLLRDQLAPSPVRSLEWDAQGRLVVEAKMQGAAFVEVYDADGKTVWSDRPADEPRGGRVMMFEIGNETVSPRVAVAAGGDVFHGSDGEYGVRRLVQGQVAQTWVRPYDRRPRRPLPRPNEDGEGGAQMVVVQRRGGGGADGAQTSVTTGRDAAQTHTFTQDELEKMLPKFSPDIRGLIGWPDGRLWVITSTDEGDNMVTDEWSERGEYRKRFAIPSRYSRLRLGADGKLYAVSHDADEYPIVHRLNVTPVP
jgi:YD repeat-containing protein